MQIQHRSPHVPVIALVVVFLASACGNPDSDNQAPAPVPSTNEQGTAELPTNFPQDFPLPSDFHITEAQFTEGDAFTQPNFLVRGMSGMSVEEIAASYHERLPDAGYDVQQQASTSSVDRAFVSFHGERVRDGSVQLDAADGSTNVLISLPLRD